MFPKILSIGDFFLPAYGLFVAAGFLAGIWLTTLLARRAGLNTEKVTNLAIYCALSGLAGAKLLMFFMDFDYYAASPSRIFSFDTLLSAGVYYGGFLAAFAFSYFYMNRQGLPWLTTADAFAPGVALGHAIGRLGCFAAGCCWGALCDRPWAVTFSHPAAHELTGVPLGIPLHPTQLYESLTVALIAFFLYRQSLVPHTPGRILALYLLLSSTTRFALEFFRHHEQSFPVPAFPITWTQWIALALAAAGAALLAALRSSPKTK